MSSAGSQNVTQVVGQVADALRARAPQRAASIAEAALAAGLRHPVLYSARGAWLSEQGRYEEALADFRKADAAAAPNAATKNAIALCLARLDRHQEAVAAYDVAIALDPGAAVLHYRKGWVHETAGDLRLALASHREAVTRQPDFAEALARLAFLAARLGQWPDARLFAARALMLDSRQIAAALALAMCEAEVGSDEAEEHINKVLADRRAGPTDRYLALGLMGDLRDRQDRVDEAFAAYRRANESVLESWSPGAMSMRQMVSSYIAYFETLAPVAPAPAFAGGRPHIFLLGFPRSGTTLLEQVLDSHDEVVAIEEKDTLADAVRKYMAQPKNLEQLWFASDFAIAGDRRAYWERVKGYGIEIEAKAVVDKMPINTVKMPLITRIFPDATILFAVRDPRDVVLSCFRRSFSFNPTTCEFLTLEGAARFYDAVMRLADLYRAKLSPRLYQIRLEDIVADFDGQIGALCEFAGLTWSQAMREFATHAKTQAIPTPSASQVIRGLEARGVGQWRRYRKHLEPVLPILAPWVERFGYPAD